MCRSALGPGKMEQKYGKANWVLGPGNRAAMDREYAGDPNAYAGTPFATANKKPAEQSLGRGADNASAATFGGTDTKRRVTSTDPNKTTLGG